MAQQLFVQDPVRVVRPDVDVDHGSGEEPKGFLRWEFGIGGSKGYGVLVERLRFDFRHRDCGIEGLAF